MAPGTPVAAADCQQPESGLTSLRGARVRVIRQFDTGGLMEGPDAAGKPQYTIWVTDSDGRFRYTGVSGHSAQVGSPFSKRKEAARVADRYLKSIRARDCGAMERLFSPRGTRVVVNGGSRRAGCQTVLKGKYLAPAVRKTARPRIEVLGGTRNIAFVGIATADTYFTLILGDPGTPDLRVFDSLPATPVKAPG